MRRLLATLALVLVAAADVAIAQTPPASNFVLSGARTYAGFERLTLSDGTARGLAAIPARDGARPVRYVWIVVEGGDVRFRLDGDTTLPTAAVGVPIRNGGDVPFMLDDLTMAKLRFIRTTAVTIDIWAIYFF